MTQTYVTVPWKEWKITKRLGSGSFGSVYEIERPVLGGSTERAAMKVISVPTDESEIGDLLTGGYSTQGIQQRFYDDLQDIAREYTLMSQLKGSSNIVYSDDLYYEAKSEGIGWNLYIRMELLRPLTEILQQTDHERLVFKVGMDLCKALMSCEQNNIIHRDIKPANILASADGNFKLGDFGIAKTSERTAGGTKIGTYNFMAPEVFNNQPYGAAVDIYSLGMVLYWMLNRRCGPFLPLPPAVPKAGELDAAKQMRFSGTPLPRPTAGSQKLVDIVLKACAFSTAERYATADAMYNDLLQAGIALYGPGVLDIRDLLSPKATEEGDATVGTQAPSFSGMFTAQETENTSRQTDYATMGNSWDATTEKTMPATQSTVEPTIGTEWEQSKQKAPEAPKKDVWEQADPDSAVVTAYLTPRQALNGGGIFKTLERTGKQVCVPIPAGVKEGDVKEISKVRYFEDGQVKEIVFAEKDGNHAAKVKIHICDEKYKFGKAPSKPMGELADSVLRKYQNRGNKTSKTCYWLVFFFSLPVAAGTLGWFVLGPGALLLITPVWIGLNALLRRVKPASDEERKRGELAAEELRRRESEKI